MTKTFKKVQHLGLDCRRLNQQCSDNFKTIHFPSKHFFRGIFPSINLSLSKRKIFFKSHNVFTSFSSNFLDKTRQLPHPLPLQSFQLPQFPYVYTWEYFFWHFSSQVHFIHSSSEQKKPFFKYFWKRKQFLMINFFFHQAWEFFIIKTEQTRKALSTFRLFFFFAVSEKLFMKI